MARSIRCDLCKKDMSAHQRVGRMAVYIGNIIAAAIDDVCEACSGLLIETVKKLRNDGKTGAEVGGHLGE